MNHHKKLIEVALPLEAINKASAREKFLRKDLDQQLQLQNSVVSRYAYDDC